MAEINREQLVTALTGKAVERGLRYEIDQETGVIRVRYPEVQSTGRDSLHKQALRGVVRRIAPSWKIEVTSLGVEVGFDVELWRGGAEPEPAPAEEDSVMQALHRIESKIDRLLGD